MSFTKEQARAYYLANREKLKAKSRDWKRANRDELNARRRAQYRAVTRTEEEKEKNRRKARAYYDANRTAVLAKARVFVPGGAGVYVFGPE